MLKSLCTDPETHLIINSVDKHGINPPTVCSINEVFIEILGPVSDFSSKESGDVSHCREASSRTKMNDKPQK